VRSLRSADLEQFNLNRPAGRDIGCFGTVSIVLGWEGTYLALPWSKAQ
jgi:hypothetical protein